MRETSDALAPLRAQVGNDEEKVKSIVSRRMSFSRRLSTGNLVPPKTSIFPASFLDKYTVQELLGTYASLLAFLFLSSCFRRVQGRPRSGAYAEVYKVVSKADGTAYALKVIFKERVKDKKRLDLEIRALQRAHHPTIVCLVETFSDDKHTFLLQDLARGGCLFDTLIELGGLGEPKTALVMKRMLEAVQYLHSIDMVHRDIKVRDDSRCLVFFFWTPLETILVVLFHSRLFSLLRFWTPLSLFIAHPAGEYPHGRAVQHRVGQAVGLWGGAHHRGRGEEARGRQRRAGAAHHRVPGRLRRLHGPRDLSRETVRLGRRRLGLRRPPLHAVRRTKRQREKMFTSFSHRLALQSPFGNDESEGAEEEKAQILRIVKCQYNFDDPAWARRSDEGPSRSYCPLPAFCLTSRDIAKDLIRKLLVLDPAARLTATEALEHPWLQVCLMGLLAFLLLMQT